MSEYRMTDTSLIKDFVFSGKAVFTVKSLSTGDHYTFRVKQKEDTYFVSLLCGGEEFIYLGFIRNMGYRTSAKSCRNRSHPSHKVIEYLLKYLMRGRLHEQFVFYHEGKCGRCGKPLTDPASIERGLGPTCFKKA